MSIRGDWYVFDVRKACKFLLQCKLCYSLFVISFPPLPCFLYLLYLPGKLLLEIKRLSSLFYFPNKLVGLMRILPGFTLYAYSS